MPGTAFLYFFARGRALRFNTQEIPSAKGPAERERVPGTGAEMLCSLGTPSHQSLTWNNTARPGGVGSGTWLTCWFHSSQHIQGETRINRAWSQSGGNRAGWQVRTGPWLGNAAAVPHARLQNDLCLFELYRASQRGSRMSVEQGGYLSWGRALGSLAGLAAQHQSKEESKSCARCCHTHPGWIQWLPRAALPAGQKGHMARGQEALAWALLPGTEHQPGGWQGQEGSLHNLDHKKTPQTNPEVAFATFFSPASSPGKYCGETLVASLRVKQEPHS